MDEVRVSTLSAVLRQLIDDWVQRTPFLTNGFNGLTTVVPAFYNGNVESDDNDGLWGGIG